MPEDQDIKLAVMQAIEELSNPRFGGLQAGGIIQKASEILGISSGPDQLDNAQALLAIFYNMFRTGELAWGHNLSNPSPPSCHITEHGRRVLENYSRDPANPAGYLAHLADNVNLNPIALSYIKEALTAYNSGCYKAAAVLTGAASESCILELRDALVAKMESLDLTVPDNMNAWIVKRILNAIKQELDPKKLSMRNTLKEKYEAYWPSFVQTIRVIRNDAGHPVSINPVTHDAVHASLLIFPEVATLVVDLKNWIDIDYD